MRKALNKLVPVMLALIMLVTAGTFAKAETATQTEVVEIATAEELLAINGNLGGNYILTEDIDLSSYENWPMIGKYVMDPNSPEGEDPVAEAAFTGVFDGNGHTISNVTIDASADMERMFGVGFFSCVGRGGVVRNVVFRDINVKGMMLVGGVVGYAFECTLDNVDLSASGRNTIGSTMVMAGGVIGGLTCSKCVNCDVENTDVLAAPGGNSGILGGGFSKPVLENCTVKNSTLSGSMDGAPAFGMDGGSWLGGLTGCVNLDDYDVREWYVKNCSVSDAEITISGKGSCVGGLIGSAGGELKNPEDPRMAISGCKVENVTITVTDSIPCVGGAVGGSFTEGGPMNSFLLDDCTLANVVISTDAEDLEASKTGLLIGEAANCQFVTKGGELLDITDRTAAAEEINSQADVTICRADGSSFEDAAMVGQVAADAGDAPSDAGEAAAPEVIEIATAEELAAVKQNLSGNYVLTADIDLNGAAWEPLGVFVPGSDENGEPTELPDLNSAFTGTFDGNGHTISNFTITQGEGAYTAGLFGCLANATLTNLTVKDVSAEGFLMVSDVAGYSFMSSISGVKLENGSIHVIPNELSEEGMFGGIVGAGMGSVITDCEAEVNITIEEGKTANVGIVGGGWQNTSAANCTGHGSIKAGSDCYGFGGISGCGFGAEYFTGCAAEDVTITVGDNCSYIGGITGYCGGYEPAELGVPVTKVTDCRTKNVTITTGDGAENTGDFVGGGFLSDEMIVYGPPFDQPTSYELVNCVAE